MVLISCGTSSKPSLTRSTRYSPTMAWPSPICRRTGTEPLAVSRRPHLRSCLYREQHRAQADKTLSPLDEWSGRANEPDDQRGDHQGLPLSKSRKSEGSRPGLRDRLQLCKAPQGSTMENALRGHLRRLDERP